MDIHSPVGRLVQGSMAMQQRKDMATNKPLFKDDGTPDMGCFFACAYPKVLPNGENNDEFDSFFGELAVAAHAAWPQFFPDGPSAESINPKFSWKYQDGDGTDTNGQSVAGKAGFAGHHIIKFDTSYPLRCFYDGKFAASEEIQNPEEVIKRGFWITVFGEVKGNNADLSKKQVPGISIYPKLITFIERGEEIKSGPDAQEVLGKRVLGWRPAASASPIGKPGGSKLPASPSTAVPARTVPVMAKPGGIKLPVVAAKPVLKLNADVLEAGNTLEALRAEGWTDEMLIEQGHATMSTPAAAVKPSLAPPKPKLVPPKAAPAHPITLIGDAAGSSIEVLLADGWAYDTLVSSGYAVVNG